MKHDIRPLDYAVSGARGFRRRGLLGRSVAISALSVVVAFGWETVRFSFPGPGQRHNPSTNWSVMINTCIWSSSNSLDPYNLLWDVWLLILPGVATRLIIVDRIVQHGADRDGTRLFPVSEKPDSHQAQWMVIGAIFAVIIAWLAPPIALVVCFVRSLSA
jgi:hypothetical protein